MFRLLFIVSSLLVFIPSSWGQQGEKVKKRPKLKSEICLEYRQATGRYTAGYDTVFIKKYSKDGTCTYNARFDDGYRSELTTESTTGKGRNRIKTIRYYEISSNDGKMYLVTELIDNRTTGLSTESEYSRGKLLYSESYNSYTEQEIIVDKDSSRFVSTIDPKTRMYTDYDIGPNGDTTKMDLWHQKRFGKHEKFVLHEQFANYPDTTVTLRTVFERNAKGDLLRRVSMDSAGWRKEEVSEYDDAGRRVKLTVRDRTYDPKSMITTKYEDGLITETTYDVTQKDWRYQTISKNEEGEEVYCLKLSEAKDTLKHWKKIYTDFGAIRTSYPTERNGRRLTIWKYDLNGQLISEGKFEETGDTLRFFSYKYDDSGKISFSSRLTFNNGERQLREESYERYITHNGGTGTRHIFSGNTSIVEKDKYGGVVLQININSRGDTTNVATTKRDKAGRSIESNETQWGYKTFYTYTKEGRIQEKLKQDGYGRKVAHKKYLYTYY